MKNNILEHNTFLASFTDLMANFLAVILLLLLLVVFQSFHSSSVRTAKVLENKPFDRYYLFLDQKVIEIDLDELSSSNFINPRLSWESPYGQVLLRNDQYREPRHDPQSFLLLIQLDVEKLRQQGQVIDQENFPIFLQQWQTAWQQQQTAATFIVLPSAFDHFAKFFEALDQSALRFRWFALSNNTLPFSYEVHDLSSRERQR